MENELVAATATSAASKAQILQELTIHSIYLMGASFVLGSMFTLFLLLVLDFMRRSKPDIQ